MREAGNLVIVSDLSIELLCVHHLLDEFSCGDPETDTKILGYMQRVQNREIEEFQTVAVVEAEARRVVGIASVVDLRLQGDEDSLGRVLTGPCVFYCLLAVDHQRTSSVIVKMLIEELEAMRDRRFALRPDYIGELAAPLSGPRSLLDFLETRQFRRLASDTTLWYRPRPTQP
jgi:hypothetical protein